MYMHPPRRGAAQGASDRIRRQSRNHSITIGHCCSIGVRSPAGEIHITGDEVEGIFPVSERTLLVRLDVTDHAVPTGAGAVLVCVLGVGPIVDEAQHEGVDWNLRGHWASPDPNCGAARIECG